MTARPLTTPVSGTEKKIIFSTAGGCGACEVFKQRGVLSALIEFCRNNQILFEHHEYASITEASIESRRRLGTPCPGYPSICIVNGTNRHFYGYNLSSAGFTPHQSATYTAADIIKFITTGGPASAPPMIPSSTPAYGAFPTSCDHRYYIHR